MTKPVFKVVAGASDWGSPLSELPSFKTYEEAHGAAGSLSPSRNALVGRPRSEGS